MIVATQIAGYLLLLGGLLLIWHVERNRLFAVLSKTPPPADPTTKALAPIWWVSLTLMLNTTSGLRVLLGLVLTSLVAAILLLACARTLAKANVGGEMLARPQPERRLLLIALFMLSFGAVIALFNAANTYAAYRHGTALSGHDASPARLPIE